ncbi:MAG: YbaK/EbsC family protein [Anaerolineales bacterium]|nr:YbaK/EbsC family protein [Anaerolineales bacterium]
MMLTPRDVQAYMDVHAIPGVIVQLDVPTLTVEAAALAVNVPPQRIVKSILFLVAERPVLAIACGLDYIERRAIANLFGVGRKRVKLATEEEVLQIAGYPAGAMPPFAHQQPLETLLDQRVLAQEQVFAGGGAENALLRLPPQEILRASGARVMDLVSLPEAELPE